jgi:hypothetical protein
MAPSPISSIFSTTFLETTMMIVLMVIIFLHVPHSAIERFTLPRSQNDREICNVHVKQTVNLRQYFYLEGNMSLCILQLCTETKNITLDTMNYHIIINEVNMRTEVSNRYIVCTVTSFTISCEPEGLKYLNQNIEVQSLHRRSHA